MITSKPMTFIASIAWWTRPTKTKQQADPVCVANETETSLRRAFSPNKHRLAGLTFNLIIYLRMRIVSGTRRKRTLCGDVWLGNDRNLFDMQMLPENRQTQRRGTCLLDEMPHNVVWCSLLGRWCLQQPDTRRPIDESHRHKGRLPHLITLFRTVPICASAERASCTFCRTDEGQNNSNEMQPLKHIHHALIRVPHVAHD